MENNVQWDPNILVKEPTAMWALSIIENVLNQNPNLTLDIVRDSRDDKIHIYYVEKKC